MTLDDLKKGSTATITAVNAGKELKNRFYSFGLIKGETVSVEKKSLGKQTLEIAINRTHIAIRSSEAEKIEVDF